MSSSSSESPAAETAVHYTPGGEAEEKHFTPKLVVALVGSLVGFIVIVVGFRLVSRRTWFAGTSDRLPQYTSHRGAPTATIERVRRRLCPLRRLKAREVGMSRIPIPSPPPPYAHALSSPVIPTTGASRPLSWLPGFSAFAADTESSGRGTSATPTFPPPTYFAHPTATPIASLNRDRR